MISDLPVTEALPDLLAALEAGNAVLVAPPGAGKTTLVPLALLDAAWTVGQTIIMLEPRRLAARAAARRMAHLLGERVGETVGYRVRFDAKVGPKTRIEVVTGGIFTRRLASDPGLEGVAVVIFDEFHERSLDGDLALALTRDLQLGLRPELRLLPMSATLDAAPVAGLLDAPVIESAGRAFPVDIVHEPRPAGSAIEPLVAQAVRAELKRSETGNILAFLPGQREIERAARLLETGLPVTTQVHRLYGSLPQKAQDAALAPTPEGHRKVVLASAIAETSLTIEGVTTVVDSGLARRPVFEPSTGLTRLVTTRASRAAADQRTGRAGRLGPGRAVRLWHAGQTAAMPAFDAPEIETADLSQLLLDLTDWGVSEPATLTWLTPPPEPSLAEARSLLLRLGAIETTGNGHRLTAHGRAMRRIAMPPRLAHMVVRAGENGRAAAGRAALLALALQERGAGGLHVDLDRRLTALERDNSARRLRDHAARMVTHIDDTDSEHPSTGTLLATAFPDRVAQRAAQAPDGSIRYRLANGRGAIMAADDLLAGAPFLVAADLIGSPAGARIVAAASITRAEIDAIAESTVGIETSFNPSTGRLSARRTNRWGAIDLDPPAPVALDDAIRQSGLLDAVAEHGPGVLPWDKTTTAFRARLDFLHRQEPEQWPAMDDATLAAARDAWLAPFLAGLKDFAALPLHDALMLRAGHPSKTELDRLAPAQFAIPSGGTLAVDYGEGHPVLCARPQQLFGLDMHPVIAGRPLAIHLQSPAGRTIQITRDLPGFWRGTWADMRSDMRGRYPKHPWPEDPITARPTARTKPRKR